MNPQPNQSVEATADKNGFATCTVGGIRIEIGVKSDAKAQAVKDLIVRRVNLFDEMSDLIKKYHEAIPTLESKALVDKINA